MRAVDGLKPEPSEMRRGADPGDRHPLRTCVGCRRTRRQSDLIRFYRRRDGEVIPSLQSLPGRSAYLCPSRSCYDLAVRRKGLIRSLAGPRGLAVRVDSQSLWLAVRKGVDDEVRVLRQTAGMANSRMTTLTTLQQGLSDRNEGA